MLIGQFRSSLVNKSLLTVPVNFQKQLVEGAFIVQGFDRNIMVLSAESFEALYQQVMKMNIADPSTRLFLRMVLGSATEIKMDKTGRFAIPQTLLEFGGIGNEVVLVGMGRYFEIWAPEVWHQQEISLQDTEANANRFAALNLAG